MILMDNYCCSDPRIITKSKQRSKEYSKPCNNGHMDKSIQHEEANQVMMFCDI